MIEEPAFYPWLTGRRNLEVLALSGPPLPEHADGPAGTSQVRASSIDAALNRAGLGAVADRKVKAYSQGMRQRLGLAVALLRRPALLLLDEPANGMDPAGIKEFRTLLRSMADEGTTVFLSSHLLAEVEHVCDEVAVLADGRLVECGSIAELSAGRPRVRVIIDPADERAARALLARWPLRADGTGELIVETATGREVNEALGRGEVWAHQIRTEHAGLEEAFLQLTEATAGEEHRATAHR